MQALNAAKNEGFCEIVLISDCVNIVQSLRFGWSVELGQPSLGGHCQMLLTEFQLQSLRLSA